MRLTDAQASAVRVGSSDAWRGTSETGVMGSTMVALERKGLAVTRWAARPYRRLTYRLTPAGRLAALELTPAVSDGVLCRCTFCEAEWPDATPGGSCGRCGQEVLPVPT